MHCTYEKMFLQPLFNGTQDLDQPGAARVLELEAFLEGQGWYSHTLLCSGTCYCSVLCCLDFSTFEWSRGPKSVVNRSMICVTYLSVSVSNNCFLSALGIHDYLSPCLNFSNKNDFFFPFVSEDDNNNFEETYGHSDTFSLSDALWTCSNMFANW